MRYLAVLEFALRGRHRFIMLNIRSVASAAIVRDKATPQAAVTVAARR